MGWEPKERLETNDQKKEYSTATKSCFEWVEAIITSIVIVVLLFTFLFRVVNVVGRSMEDTIHSDDKVLLTNLFYEPENGDVVVISRAQHFEEPIIKRVIATEGQSLKIDFNTGDVYVDGVLLDEPYIKTPTTDNEGGEIPEVVPEGYVFVMGDNRGDSMDSRSEKIGLIDKRNIIGKAQYIVFPFDRIGGIG